MTARAVSRVAGGVTGGRRARALAKAMLCPFVVEDERPDYMRDGATDDSDLLDAVLVEEARAALPSPSPSQAQPPSQPAASAPTVARAGSASSMHPVGTILARELATLQDSCGPVRGLLGVTERMLVFEPLRSEPWVQVHGAARFRCVLARSQVLAYVWRACCGLARGHSWHSGLLFF